MNNRDNRLQRVLDAGRENPSLMGDTKRSEILFISTYDDIYSEERAREVLRGFSINRHPRNPDVIEFYAILTAGAMGTTSLNKAKRFSQHARGRAL